MNKLNNFLVQLLFSLLKICCTQVQKLLLQKQFNHKERMRFWTTSSHSILPLGISKILSMQKEILRKPPAERLTNNKSQCKHCCKCANEANTYIALCAQIMDNAENNERNRRTTCGECCWTFKRLHPREHLRNYALQQTAKRYFAASLHNCFEESNTKIFTAKALRLHCGINYIIASRLLLRWQLQ